MSCRDIDLELPHIRLAAREWGLNGGEPVLALHGWLDNAASFDRLAPLLPDLHLVALDLAGHGRSQRRPAGGSHHFVDWVPEVAAAADALGWSEFSLVGHSMGAGISSLIPATFPERVKRVVLLEGAGPFAADAAKAPAQLASALADEVKIAAAATRVFPEFEAAVAARARDTDLDRESARLLVERGTEAVDGGYVFTFDPRLKNRSRIRFTESQVVAFLSAISCPALFVRAREGWPVPEDLMEARLAVFQNLERVEIRGGHHVHLTHPERVAPLISDFFSAMRQA